MNNLKKDNEKLIELLNNANINYDKTGNFKISLNCTRTSVLQ